MLVIKASASLLVILQGTFAVTLKMTLAASAVRGILALSAESALAAAACVRVMRIVSVAPNSVADSVRIASLVRRVRYFLRM